MIIQTHADTLFKQVEIITYFHISKQIENVKCTISMLILTKKKKKETYPTLIATLLICFRIFKTLLF